MWCVKLKKNRCIKWYIMRSCNGEDHLSYFKTKRNDHIQVKSGLNMRFIHYFQRWNFNLCFKFIQWCMSSYIHKILDSSKTAATLYYFTLFVWTGKENNQLTCDDIQRHTCSDMSSKHHTTDIGNDVQHRIISWNDNLQ